MEKWIKANIDFGARGAIFYLPVQIMHEQERRLLMQKLRVGDLDGIEAIVAFLIVSHRPELAGGTVTGLEFSFERQSWEFGYTHRTLPRIQPGSSYLKIPLVPEKTDQEAGKMPCEKKVMEPCEQFTHAAPDGIPGNMANPFKKQYDQKGKFFKVAGEEVDD
jgi:hypothetical protein